MGSSRLVHVPHRTERTQRRPHERFPGSRHQRAACRGRVGLSENPGILHRLIGLHGGRKSRGRDSRGSQKSAGRYPSEVGMNRCGAVISLAALATLTATTSACSFGTVIQKNTDAIGRSTSTVETNIKAIEEASKGTTTLVPVLERVTRLEPPLQSIAGLDPTLKKIAALDAPLAKVVDLEPALTRIVALDPTLSRLAALDRRLEDVTRLEDPLKRAADLRSTLDTITKLRPALEEVTQLKPDLVAVVGLKDTLVRITALQQPIEKAAGLADPLNRVAAFGDILNR